MKSKSAPAKTQKTALNTKLRVVYLVLGVLAAVPVLTMLVLLVKYSVNTPWWDQWSVVDLMAKLHSGTLSIGDLWQQHNEHRILVPQAVELGLGGITGWNFRVFELMSWVMATCSFGVLILLLKRIFLNRKIVFLLAAVFAWLLFSPAQWINWLFGFQLAFFMGVFTTILTTWLLTRKDALKSQKIFILALVLASIATYCNGNGLIIWPVGLGILLWRRAERTRLAQWSGVGLVMIASYLYHFRRSPDSPPLSVIIREPVAVIKYTLAYLGRNFATTPTSARWAGTALLLVMAVSIYAIYKKGQLSKVMEWLALALYVIFTGLLAAISRLNFGVDHGFNATSYITISVLFIIAVIALAAYAISLWAKDFYKKDHRLYWAGALITIVLIAAPIPAYVSNYKSGLANFRGLGQHLKDVQHCVYTAKSANDDCLLIVFPQKAYAWHDIQFLRGYGWGGFKN